ncbi:membrane cofactor protein-like isoform X7 [Hyla sarda]|uniref:membrane cofactor protein-like isoform X7 n=1 Tax=Hyla sarda TaxID=327740 RepID=UPI0024C338C6|nr:membrane cofactor protein-like isoform X7 [Hyla sarda]
MEYHWIILLLPAFFARSHGSCGAPPRLDFAGLDPEFIDKDNFPLDARVNYTCRPGFIKIPGTQNFITCLSGSTWSTPQTFCQRRQCPSPTDIPNGKMEITDTLFGSRVNYTCDLGYRMLTKRNYIECQADGTWSTPVPVCEVQVCPPPDAIPDGRYDPDEEEYNYQAAIKYSCLNNKATLIGESTLSCTAYGNWSSDPPRCKVVECLNPDVKNARKISGFIGPYILNSAVRFECLPGFIMDGEPFVRCNVSDQWEPPLPTCRSNGSNVGAIVAGTFPECIQQDGAPPHYGCQVRAFLDEQFPGKWIGHRGPVEWPPRSPDLTTLDFHLWGHLKAIVYAVKI